MIGRGTVSRLKPHWMAVVSAEYTTGGWGYDPPEPARDVAMVRATTHARARVLAVRWWRRMNRLRRTDVYETVSWGENPFRGMKVTDEQERCERCGRPWLAHDSQQLDACDPAPKEVEP